MKQSEWQTMVMKNFDVPTTASGTIRVPCKICATVISGTTKSPANFLKHLKRKHSSVFSELTNLKSQIEKIPDSGSFKHATVAGNLTSSSEDKGLAYSKKSIYSPDFKLRILQYFFENGGEANFGLKSRTASLFNVDKKTINRMLCNPELVKKANRMAVHKKSGIITQNNRKISKPSKFSKGDSESNSRTPSPFHNTEVPILDLPEDPDYSVLKKHINSSVNEVSGLVQIFHSGTDEVQNIVLNECDLILECKVCKNMFRSVVNLIAHKRIYCQDHYKSVRGFYQQEDTIGMTTESYSKINLDQIEEEEPKTKSNSIDQIASRLASKKSAASKSSSSTNKGSIDFFDRILESQYNRSKEKKNCSIVLKDIGNSKNAVAQGVTAENVKTTVEDAQEIIEQATERKKGSTAVLDSDGSIVNTFYGEPAEEIPVEPSKVEAVTTESPIESGQSTPAEVPEDKVEKEPIERTIFTCPICSTEFLSMGGCLKHLLKLHKKKKQHRERLRHVISRRTFTRKLTKEEMTFTAAYKRSTSYDSNGRPIKRSRTEEPQKGDFTTESQPVREDLRPNAINRCPRCKRGFLTAGALGSHFKYCQFPLSPLAVPDMPEKKIEIQIRKDYKKDGFTNSPQNTASNDPIPQLLIRRSVSDEWQSSVQIKDKKTFKNRLEKKILQVAPMIGALGKKGKGVCIPCNRKFNKSAQYKSHVAKHFHCTRYRCMVCNEYRSYHRYSMLNHLVSIHHTSVREIEKFVAEDGQIGEFTLHLIQEKLLTPTNVKESQDKDISPSSVKESDEKSTKAPPESAKRAKKAKEVISADSKVRKKVVSEVSVQSSTELQKATENKDSIVNHLGKKGESVGKAKEDKQEHTFKLQKLSGPLIKPQNDTKSTSDAEKSEAPTKIIEKIDKPRKLPEEKLGGETPTNVRKDAENISKTTEIQKNSSNKLDLAKGNGDVCSTENADCLDLNSAKQERPQRVRKIIEKKDFVYEIRKSGSLLVDEEMNKFSELKRKPSEDRTRENSVENEVHINGCNTLNKETQFDTDCKMLSDET